MRDNWCIGYTRKFTVGVWVGNSTGLPMRDITGMTGAAPVWLAVVSYLQQRFDDGSGIARPTQLIKSRVEFPNSIEPPREELFLAGTEPDAVAMRIDSSRPRIASPVDGSIVAFDPDIPEQRQRMSFETSRSARDMRWMLDGVALDAADGPQLWAPTAGKHHLALIDRSRDVIDAVTFEVRGSRSTAELEARAR
jgi:penicillin-binding protein 1C